MAALNFDPRTVAPEAPRAPIPAGVYLAHIIESDVVATQAGGQMLKLTHEVLDGQFKGRRVWSQINIRNSSAEAERIGQAQLSALCHAINHLAQLTDSAVLHMKPLKVRVTIKPAGLDRNGVHRDERNEVRGYEAPTAGAPGVQPGAPAGFRAPAAAAAPAANPWVAAAPQAPAPAAQPAPAPAQIPPPQATTAPWARRATAAA
jgi:hypothetical protein